MRRRCVQWVVAQSTLTNVLVLIGLIVSTLVLASSFFSIQDDETFNYTEFLSKKVVSLLEPSQVMSVGAGPPAKPSCITLVHIPKTGGTSINRYLGLNGGCMLSKQACYDDLWERRKKNYMVVMAR